MWFDASFDAIHQVETMQLRFGASLIIDLAWEITKLDIVDYVAGDGSVDWSPEWSPAPLVVSNPASIVDSGLSIVASPIVPKLHRVGCKGPNGKRARRFVATQQLELSGEFFEALSMSNYVYIFMIYHTEL